MNNPAKNTAVITVNRICVVNPIVPFEVKILKNKDPKNKNNPIIINEKINVINEILPSRLLENSSFSTSNLAPQSEQKSPS